MAEDRKGFSIKKDASGEVQVADEVVAIIAALAATEVDGVSSMAGNITNEIISRLGMRHLSHGVRVEMHEESVVVMLALNITYGYSIPEVTVNVQKKVRSTVESMTGLTVSGVNIRISDVDMKSEA